MGNFDTSFSETAQHYFDRLTKDLGSAAEVLALGGLGFGMDVPDGNSNRLAPANDSNAACSNLFTDYYNNDTSYSVGNPEETGLRALIESAIQSVFVSQQDLIALCVAPYANANGVDTWKNGNQIANHAKVISVDNAFYNEYQSVIWYHSKPAAIVDFETGVCNI